MKYWIFSILTCALSYLIGSLSTNLIASRLIFHKNLRKLGKGERWLPNFYRLYGVKGFLKLALVEFVKDAIPVLIGGLLFSGGENDEVGRALAAFCVVLGRLYPSMFGFRGSFFFRDSRFSGGFGFRGDFFFRDSRFSGRFGFLGGSFRFRLQCDPAGAVIPGFEVEPGAILLLQIVRGISPGPLLIILVLPFAEGGSQGTGSWLCCPRPHTPRK